MGFIENWLVAIGNILEGMAYPHVPIMSGDHPFQYLFESFGKMSSSHAEEVNREAFEEIRDGLSGSIQRAGRCFLLKSPQAGYGKTHLLSRTRHQLGSTHEFIALQAVGGDQIDAQSVLKDVLKRLVRSLPKAGGLTVMDLVTRRLFATSLQPLVNSGEVPCQDREDALNSLKLRPIETLDFHNPSAITAHWAQENFELLGPRLSLEMSQRNSLPLREVSFWVNAFFEFASNPIGDPTRSNKLNEDVFRDIGLAHERLVGLLGLLTSIMRVVLVADELEGFFGNEKAGQRTASFLMRLQQEAERVDLVIATNEDLWDSAFRPLMSSGLVERFEENEISLKPLERWQVKALLDSRLPGQGEKLLRKLDADRLPTRAREVIREARDVYADHEGGEEGFSAAYADDVFEEEDKENVGAGSNQAESNAVGGLPEAEEELPELKDVETPFAMKSDATVEEESLEDAAPLPATPLEMGEPESAFADSGGNDGKEVEDFFGDRQESKDSPQDATIAAFQDAGQQKDGDAGGVENSVESQELNPGFQAPEPPVEMEQDEDVGLMQSRDSYLPETKQEVPESIPHVEPFTTEDKSSQSSGEYGSQPPEPFVLSPQVADAPESIPVPMTTPPPLQQEAATEESAPFLHSKSIEAAEFMEAEGAAEANASETTAKSDSTVDEKSEVDVSPSEPAIVDMNEKPGGEVENEESLKDKAVDEVLPHQRMTKVNLSEVPDLKAFTEPPVVQLPPRFARPAASAPVPPPVNVPPVDVSLAAAPPSQVPSEPISGPRVSVPQDPAPQNLSPQVPKPQLPKPQLPGEAVSLQGAGSRNDEGELNSPPGIKELPNPFEVPNPKVQEPTNEPKESIPPAKVYQPAVTPGSLDTPNPVEVLKPPLKQDENPEVQDVFDDQGDDRVDELLRQFRERYGDGK